MKPDEPLALALAKRITAITADRITHADLDWARSAVIDTVGVALGAASEPAVGHLLGLPGTARPKGSCTLIGTNFRTGPVEAALVNGTASHALDFDDGASAVLTHPSTVLVPALLALAEHVGSSGAHLLNAYVVGLEAGIRFGMGIVPGHLERGWHPTSTIGVFSATAGAAWLLRLDTHQTAMALGIAASMAGGIGANFGSMTKPLHSGMAARDGVMAALLAERGFTGSDTAFEGPRGFLRAFNGTEDFRAEVMLDGWMAPSVIGTTELLVKQFPCCGSTHSPIELALSLRNTHELTPNEIESIEIRMNPARLRSVDRQYPTDGLSAKFSVQYAVCRALSHGDVDLAAFEDGAWLDATVTSLLDRTTTLAGKDQDASNPIDFGSELFVTTSDGRRLTSATESGLWRGNRRPLSVEESWQKFHGCAVRALPKAQVRAAFDALSHLQDHKTLSEPLLLLTPGGVGG